jgi:hypothetical protein
VFDAHHIACNVIGAKPKVHDNLFVATILIFPTTVCWSRSAFGALGNLSSALDIGACLLGMAFTIGSMRDPNNGHWDMSQLDSQGYEKLTLLGL